MKIKDKRLEDNLQPADNKKIFTISGLTRYYFKEYGFGEADSCILNCCRLKFLRITKERTFDDGFNLNMIFHSGENHDGPYAINKKLFEYYCLGPWLEYLRKTYSSIQTEEGREKLDSDLANWLSADKAEVHDKIQKMVDEQPPDEAVETKNETEDEKDERLRLERAEKTAEELRYKMMLNAVYDSLFEGFDMEKLKQDCILDEFADTSYKSCVSVDEAEAIYRLRIEKNNYKYYVGKRRRDTDE